MKKHLIILILFCLSTTTIICMELKYSLLQGEEIKQHLPFIVEQGIKTWREYPYLYDGDYNEQEAQWLEFIRWENNALAIAHCDGKIIGFMAGVNLIDYDQHFSGIIKLFQDNKLNPADYYYIASCIVNPEDRGKKIAEKLGQLLGNFIRKHNYKYVCFATSNKDASDPYRPVTYRPIEHLWLKLGFEKTKLIVPVKWDTLQPNGSKINQENELVFWTRSIES